MTQTIERPSGTAAVTPDLRQVGRRSISWIVVALIVLAIAALGVLTVGGESSTGPALGASNPAPDGAQAVAQVLKQHGVTVTEASTLASARRAAGPGSTMLVYDPSEFLGSKQLATLRSAASTLVLIQPGFDALNALAPGVHDTGAASRGARLDAACSLPAATRAGTVSAPGHAYRVTGVQATGCFPTADGTFAFVSVPANDSTVQIVGSTSIFSNQNITDAGNAALALNLLGEHSSLVWYLPTIADLESNGPPSLSELTPGWVTPVVVLLIAVFVAAAIWRGRRFGPLVIENLPVVVRSTETMEGRARLYQRSSARRRALDALRIGTIGRLARTAGLSRTATVTEVADAVAALIGQDPEPVLNLLRDANPQTDAELIGLSDQLLRLESAAGSAARPSTAPGTGRMES